MTNFKTIESRIARLKKIKEMEEDGTFDVLPKREVLELNKEKRQITEELRWNRRNGWTSRHDLRCRP